MNPQPKPGKKKKKKRGVSPEKLKKIYAEVIERDVVCQNPYCESGWPLDWPHHVTKKSQYGLDDPKNLVLLCCHSHRQIHHTGELKVTGEYPNWTFTRL